MKKSFLAGLVILLPIAVTFFLLFFVLNLFTSPFLYLVTPLISKYQNLIPLFQSPEFVTFVARVVIIILFCLFIFILGVLGRWFIFRILLQWGNALLMKIPFFSSIYHTAKDLITSIFSKDERKAFLHPILVHFPSRKSLCVSFLSGTVPPECEKKLDKKLIPIFVPTAPHPISGYLIFAEADDVHKIKMTNEEAIKFTVSCGVITPESPEIPQDPK